MRGSFLLPLVLAGGCAVNRGIRTEQVGTGHGAVTTRGDGASDVSAAPGGGGMPLPRGTYDFELRIGVPRAQLVDWKVACTGVDERSGQVGQAFEDYKQQRLTQLTRAREHQAAIYARAVTQPPPNAVVVARPLGVRVVTPIGRLEVQPAPVVVRSEEPAPQPDLEVPPVTELPPGDYGQGTFPARVRVVLPSDGVCAITALADDRNVTAFYAVTRERDLGVEAAERKQVVYVGAVSTRGRLTERLVAYGADPLAKQQRLEAEARARAEAEARRGAELARQREAELRVDVELRRKADAAAAVRGQREAEDAARRREHDAVAEIERRERLLIEQERAERAEEMAYAVAWEAEAPARARADLLIYQKEVSIRWRLTLIAWLVTHGHADPDRRGRIARAQAQRDRELQAGLLIKLEIERTERERLIRIRMEQDREELERQRALDQIARDARARKQRLEEQRAQERLARWEAQRAERENREAIERARRDQVARELAELKLRRANAATRIRQTVVSTLIGYGAKLRPPMPELRLESPGPAPFDGAQWAVGRWEWNSTRVEWQWRGGGWRDTTRFGDSGGQVVVTNHVVVEPTVVVAPPTVTTVVVTPAVVIDANARPGYEPRPTYQRPERRPGYQPRPRPQRPGYQPRPAAQRPSSRDPNRPAPGPQTKQSDDDKRRR